MFNFFVFVFFVIFFVISIIFSVVIALRFQFFFIKTFFNFNNDVEMLDLVLQMFIKAQSISLTLYVNLSFVKKLSM